MSLLAMVGRGRTGAAPPPAGDWDLEANRPSDTTTLITDWNVENFTNTPDPLGSWEIWTDPVTGQVWQAAMNRATGITPDVIDDATTPTGTGRVLRVSYDSAPDGYEPRMPYYAGSAYTRWFCSFIVKFDYRWDQPDASGVKWILPTQVPGSNGMPGWFGLGQEVPASPNALPNVRFTYQIGQCGSGNCPVDRDVLQADMSTSTLQLDTWYKIQFFLDKSASTPRISLWVNDVLVSDKSDFGWDSNGGINGCEFGGPWGGGTPAPAPAGAAVYFDRIAIWGGN